MTPQLPDISEDQRAVLERIYAIFRAGSPWPRFADLDREFDRKGIDLAQILRAIPLACIFLDRNRLIDPRPDMELQLSLFGIAQCPDSENDLALFFDALRWLVTVEVEHVIDPSDPSTVEVFATAAGFNDHLSSTPWAASPSNVRKVGMLLINEPPGVWQSFGGGGDDWRASLRRAARKYRDVATLDDYLSIVADAAPQLYGLNPSNTPAGLIPSAGSMTEAAQMNDPPYVFVIMPFDEAWSDGAYAFIRRVAATVDAHFPLLIERADEITASGRITDQIETAIQRSAVVIADITGVNPGEPARNHPNPNVMWELGYAHALGKEVIILNQDPKQSPFDLSVHRQVAYATSPTSANEQLLERHLRHALGAP